MLNTPVLIMGVARVVDMIVEHGSATMQSILVSMFTYVNTLTRVAQNVYHMYKEIMCSISKKLQQKSWSTSTRRD